MSDAVASVESENNTPPVWNSHPADLLCPLCKYNLRHLTTAFQKYLRVHFPLATVIASQIIAVLIVFLMLIQVADFSRRV